MAEGVPTTGLPRVWVGTAKVVITPPVGVELAGFIARTTPMVGVHDELHARALVWSGTGTLDDAVALVTLDVVDLNAGTVAAIRAWATAQIGIPGERIGVACTHTHGGPATLGGRWLGRVDADYLALLPRLVGGAIAQAARCLEPTTPAYACGHEETVGKNRRVPAGVRDPDVPTLRFQRDDGTIAALLLSYACHPVTLGPDNLLATADYPGYAMRALEAIYPGALVAFATGCCGQINTGHTSRDGVRGRGQHWRTFDEAERLGRIIAGAAMQATEGRARAAVARRDAPAPTRAVPVGAARRTLGMPLLPRIPDDELARLAGEWRADRDRLGGGEGSPGLIAQYDVWLEWAEAARSGRLPAMVEAEVQVLTLGDTALVLLPGEMFVEFGLAIKERAAGRNVVTIAYANGTPGYIPHRSAYPEGGYEVSEAFRYYGYPACFAPEAGEGLVEAALALLAE